MGFGNGAFQAAKIAIDGVTLIENVYTGKVQTTPVSTKFTPVNTSPTNGKSWGWAAYILNAAAISNESTLLEWTGASACASVSFAVRLNSDSTSIDGFASNNVENATTQAVTLSTTSPNDLIIVCATGDATSNTTQTISDTANLTWSSSTIISAIGSNVGTNIFYAVASSPLTDDVITINYSSATTPPASAEMMAFGVTNVVTSDPIAGGSGFSGSQAVNAISLQSAPINTPSGPTVGFVFWGGNSSSSGFTVESIVLSLSNTDGSLTISPSSGNVTASLNESHSNYWQAEQKFVFNGSFNTLEAIDGDLGITTFYVQAEGGSNPGETAIYQHLRVSDDTVSGVNGVIYGGASNGLSSSTNGALTISGNFGGTVGTTHDWLVLNSNYSTTNFLQLGWKNATDVMPNGANATVNSIFTSNNVLDDGSGATFIKGSAKFNTVAGTTPTLVVTNTSDSTIIFEAGSASNDEVSVTSNLRVSNATSGVGGTIYAGSAGGTSTTLPGQLTIAGNLGGTVGTTFDYLILSSNYSTTNFLQLGWVNATDVMPNGANATVDSIFTNNNVLDNGSGGFYLKGKVQGINGISTKGLGVGAVYGLDNRTGVTTTDSSAITLYTTTAPGQLYKLSGRILATAGATPSATYTLKWTEGGTAITKALAISALDSDSDFSALIQPDNATAITAQITALTSTTVNVAASVEQID